jgi:hypothetical protein
MPVCGDAGEMEEMLAGELGEVIEGPVELALNPAADNWEDAEEGSVTREEDEAKEVEEGDAEAEAGGGAPWSGRSGGSGAGDRRGDECVRCGGGGAWELQTGPRVEMILLMDDSDVNFVAARSYEAQVARSGIYFVPAEAPKSLRYFDFARQTRPVFQVDRNFSDSLSVSSDGRWILYSQTGDMSGDIMLVNHFQ